MVRTSRSRSRPASPDSDPSRLLTGDASPDAVLRGVIREMLGRQRGWIALAIVLVLTQITITTLNALTIAAVFDQGIVEKSVPLGDLVGRLIFLATCAVIVSVPLRLTTARIVYQLEFDMRTWLYDKLAHVPAEALSGLTAGQLVTRAISDLTALEALTALLPVLVVGAVILTGIAIVMILISPPMALLTLIAIPVNLALVKRAVLRLRALGWLTLHRQAEVTTRIDEPVRGIRVVKAFAAEAAEEARVAVAAREAFRASLTRIATLARLGLPVKALPIVMNGLLVLCGAYLAVQGSFSIGALVVYLGFAVVFTGVAGQFDDIAATYTFARSGSSRILEMISRSDPVDSSAGASLPPESAGGLALHAAMRASGPIVDVVAAPGVWVSVTGPHGSGTSALGRIAVGAEAPASGSVVLDGVALADLAVSERVRAARLLTNEPFLFGRSVRENLVIGLDGAIDDSVLWAALAAAGADEVVAGLDGGLDAQLGDRGLTLSGGQRQRVALARALVRPPRLLVLDEALSAVNPQLEVRILERVRAHAPQTTVLVVSRRPGPLALAEVRVELSVVVELAVAEAFRDPDSPTFDRPSDPVLAAAVDAIEVTQTVPPVAADVAVDDSVPPGVAAILAPVRRQVVRTVVTLIGLSLAAITPAVLFQFAVNGIRAKDVVPAAMVAAALVPVAAIVSALTYAVRRSLALVNESALYVLRLRVFRRLSRLGVDFYDRELPGKVAARVVYDFDRITEFLSTGAFPLTSAVTLFVIANLVLAVVDLGVYVAILPFLVVMLVATTVEVPLAQRAYVVARERVGAVVERFHEDFSGRHVIQSFGGRDAATVEFVAMCWSLRSARKRATTIANIYLSVMEYLAALSTAILLGVAGGRAIAASATIGSVVFLQLLLTQALAPIPALSQILQSWLNARASLRQLAAPFAVPVTPADRPEAQECGGLDGALALASVGFAYPGTSRPVVHDVDLAIAPGEIVAFVGPTGAGKSTLAKLLARVYDPDVGVVSADAVDVRAYTVASYRRRLGVVPQDAFCFAGTVASNVAYGRPAATDDEIAAAVHGCGGSPLFGMLGDGLATEVLEEGTNLAPVARSWIALARMWLLRPDVLVLDEATSALPAEDEARVMDALRAAGRTAVVVTHRLEVARRADRVVLVDGGTIREQGSHAELVAADGAYRAIWNAGGADPFG